MSETQQEELSFHPEELSLGPVGDALFLDIRHRIMTAHFGPCRWFSVTRLATARSIDETLAFSVCRALQRHGYVSEVGLGKYSVKGWSADEFQDALKKMRDSQRSIAQKYSQQISPEDSIRLAASLDFRLSSNPAPHDVERFYVRWWMFFHCTLHAYGMQSFRTLALTITSPYLRRRLITGLSPELLNATFAGLRQLSAAFDLKQPSDAALLVDQYIDAISPLLTETNESYNRYRESSEIDYAFSPISGRPLFRAEDDRRPDIHRGYREPLNWQQFMAMRL